MNRIPSPYANNQEESLRETSRDEDRPREQPREEIRGATRLVDDGRQRARTGSSALYPFDIEDIKKVYAPTDGHGTPAQVAREIHFNWKLYELYGKKDYSQERAEHDQGWENVLHSDFPGRFAPSGTEGPVIVKDLILKWRPMRLTVDARNEEIALANRAMQVNRTRMVNAPEGQAPRTEPVIRTSRETIEIPE